MSKIHGGNIFQFAHEQRIEPYEVVDFSANINPLGPSQRGLDALNVQLRYISHYPDATNDDVLNAIADTYGMDKHQIIVGNGAAELLYAICRLPGYTGAFVPAPGFSEYKEALEASKIPVLDIFYRPREDDNGKPYFEVPYLALETFAAELKGQDGRIIVFLGNPNNPDGTLLDKDHIRTVASMLKDANSLLVIDESFIDFVGNDPLQDNEHSIRSLVNEFDNIIVVHSFTKFYAVPGLRIGAAFTNETLITQLQQYIPSWSVNTLAQAYTKAALNDVDYIKRTKQELNDERAFMYNALDAIEGITVYPPSANFILFQVNQEGITANYINEELKKYNMIVRNCDSYVGLTNHWVRIAIKDHDTNIKLVDKLTDILKV
ncbi:MAG: pyridoxal phosphate-dependent class II aminotransferase [Veillonella dispar]|uniref:pyridoxal phosphate-dependent aminotransferase n=1 Tax=Veillonella dispar TaxID=39778 RepID=UPI00280B8E4B|nr:pyridoxal phosphate-dependent class II aminotransferase [Veillonella dispar]MDU4878280.1 pyridoxal phosphate-dependent class II aminotransferase [Veillonella dispar]MDU4885485.1 pyridoxal phosphate-dependent class II aminotransferase [Veillonella dispar]